MVLKLNYRNFIFLVCGLKTTDLIVQVIFLITQVIFNFTIKNIKSIKFI